MYSNRSYVANIDGIKKNPTNPFLPSFLESDSLNLKKNSGFRYVLRSQSTLLSVSQYIRQILNTVRKSYAPA